MKKPTMGMKKASDRGGPPGKIPAGIGKPVIKVTAKAPFPLHPKGGAKTKKPMSKPGGGIY